MNDLTKFLKNKWFLVSTLSFISPIIFVFLTFLYINSSIKKETRDESLLLSGMLKREIANVEKTLQNVGSLILLQGKNEEAIEQILYTTSKAEIPFFLGSYVSLTNKDGDFLINGLRGKVKESAHIRDRDYYNRAIKYPNILHIMKPSKNKFNSETVIPTCLSISNKEGEIVGILVLGIRLDAFVNRLRPFINLDETIYVVCREGNFFLMITASEVKTKELSEFHEDLEDGQIVLKKLGKQSYFDKILLFIFVAAFLLFYYLLIVFYKKKIIYKSIVRPIELSLKIKSKTSFFHYYFLIDNIEKELKKACRLFEEADLQKNYYLSSRESYHLLVRFYEKGVYLFYKKLMHFKARALLLRHNASLRKEEDEFFKDVSELDISNLDFLRKDFCLYDFVHNAFVLCKPLFEKHHINIDFKKDSLVDKKFFYACEYYYLFILRCILHYVSDIIISNGHISINVVEDGPDKAIVFITYSGVIAEDNFYASIKEKKMNPDLCIYSYSEDIVERAKEFGIDVIYEEYSSDQKSFKIYVKNEESLKKSHNIISFFKD